MKSEIRKVQAAILSLTLTVLIAGSCRQAGVDEGDAEMKKFTGELLEKMTLEEKIGQLSLFTSGWAVTGPTMSDDYRDQIRQGRVGGIFNAFTVDYVTSLQKTAVEETRLGIPLLFGLDVIHGHRTIFPIPLAQACSWDMESVERSERIAASEATAEGVNWTFAPMVDIARDPRWGRVMEGAGEDTYLGSAIAAARVRGFQGDDPASPSTLMACVKHFAAYGAPQAGRDYHTVDISDRSLMEWYLPPYKAAIDAGAMSVMTSFNEIAGIPSSSNRWLLTDLLRDSWGFTGMVVSDYTSINELIPHTVAADSADAARLAINAGLDMDMEGRIYLLHLEDLAGKGLVTEETIDRAVLRILEAKYRLGLFDDPYRYCNKERETGEIMTADNLAFARSFAAESMVLLKNENYTLPVKNDIGTIAVIGPLADSKADMLGGWSAAGDPAKSVTLLEGVTARAGKGIRVMHAMGCEAEGNDMSGISRAIAVARQSDYVILALGEKQAMSGEAASRTDISLPGIQMELARKIIETGKPVVVVLFNGRPLVIEELQKIAPAILEAWYGGTQAGNAVADILFGDVNPSGKLTMTFPRNMGQIPLFYNSKSTGRPFDERLPDDKFKSRYIDSPNTPLYPFGYGLSYTTFSYSEISLNASSFSSNDEIVASAVITNTGDYDGKETVQLYIRDRVGDVTRPLKELKGFTKVFIAKGETVKVTFSLRPDDLSYYHSDMSFGWDPGEYELFISPSSDDSNHVVFTMEGRE